MREIVGRVLVRRGYHVLLADSPQAAMPLLRENAGSVRLLLTDLRMPGGPGARLTAEAREVVPELRVLYMSGFGADHAQAEGLVEPGAAVLQKPFTPATL